MTNLFTSIFKVSNDATFITHVMHNIFGSKLLPGLIGEIELLKLIKLFSVFAMLMLCKP